MKPVTCGCESRQVDLEVAAPFGDLGADVDVLGAVAVVVEQRLAVVDAIRPGRDTARTWRSAPSSTASIAACAVAGAELVEQGGKAPLADPGRADHRREVAAELARVPHVHHDHLEHVLAQPRPPRRA